MEKYWRDRVLNDARASVEDACVSNVIYLTSIRSVEEIKNRLKGVRGMLQSLKHPLRWLP